MPVERIVVKGVNWVGDTVITTPFYRALRGLFPAASITVTARPWTADLLRRNPAIDDLWEIDEMAGPASWLDLVRRLRRGRFDLGFALPGSFSAAVILRAGGVRRRVGYALDGRSLLLTDPLPVTDALRRSHQVDWYLNLLTRWGRLADVRRDPLLPLDAALVAEMRSLLAQVGFPSGVGRPLVGINPGAFYGSAKRWLPERFAGVARRLIEQRGAAVVVTGTAAEKTIGEEVVRLTDRPGRIACLAGELRLDRLPAFLSLLDLYLTNDSGAMHVAAAVGLPLVAVFGSTDWVTTAPLAESAVIVRRDTPCAPCLLRECPTDHRCMTAVTVDEVTAAAGALLDRRFPRGPAA